MFTFHEEAPFRLRDELFSDVFSQMVAVGPLSWTKLAWAIARAEPYFLT
jgi:hypothetical protein